MDLTTLNDAYAAAIAKERRNIAAIGPSFPHAANGPHGEYNCEPPYFWTGGFWAGILWLVYQQTHAPEAYATACAIEQKQDALLDSYLRLHHDVGFMWMPSAVAHFEREPNPASQLRGLRAASVLASRFNLAGRFFRAWNEDVHPNSAGLAIIDCMMNLSLLYWASRQTHDPRFAQLARAHADTALQNFVREDGTVCHIVRFDPDTGEKLEVLHGQGKAPDSAWARGQAWAIYGFALSCRETGEQRFLAEAQKCADWFLAHLPESGVPCWDFMADARDDYAKDASAACCAASGLLEIAALCKQPEQGAFYREQAAQLLTKLTRSSACFDDTTQGLIRNSTVNFCAGKHINEPIIYGDFFYLEALAKLLGKPGIF